MILKNVTFSLPSVRNSRPFCWAYKLLCWTISLTSSPILVTFIKKSVWFSLKASSWTSSFNSQSSFGWSEEVLLHLKVAVSFFSFFAFFYFPYILSVTIVSSYWTVWALALGISKPLAQASFSAEVSSNYFSTTNNLSELFIKFSIFSLSSLPTSLIEAMFYRLMQYFQFSHVFLCCSNPCFLHRSINHIKTENILNYIFIITEPFNSSISNVLKGL